ncbi:MAG: type II secretion system protein [Planctomycetes bacterium]|nr:type II secretion system protein [Planctomycetota bacterium]
MRRAQNAFTLLELLLVVFILAALAATTSSMVESAHEQARYDVTAQRLDEIRDAVAGARGGAAGFASDCGRLPRSIGELLERPADVHAWRPDPAASGLAYGWRGPYLRATGPGEFFDGWGSRGENFGWQFFVSPNATPVGAPVALPPGPALWVGSLGLDGLIGGTDGDWSRDFPHTWIVDEGVAYPVTEGGTAPAPLVGLDDYTVDLEGWTVVVDLVNGEAGAEVTLNLALRLHVVVDGAPQVAVSDPLPVTLSPGATAPVTFSFPAAPFRVTWGVRPAEVVEAGTGPARDWPRAGTGTPEPIDLRPRQARPARLRVPWRVR